jgi:hypothetical protein
MERPHDLQIDEHQVDQALVNLSLTACYEVFCNDLDSGRITILVYHCFSRSTLLVIYDRSFDADASFSTHCSTSLFVPSQEWITRICAAVPGDENLSIFCGSFCGKPWSSIKPCKSLKRNEIGSQN